MISLWNMNISTHSCWIAIAILLLFGITALCVTLEVGGLAVRLGNRSIKNIKNAEEKGIRERYIAESFYDRFYDYTGLRRHLRGIGPVGFGLINICALMLLSGALIMPLGIWKTALTVALLVVAEAIIFATMKRSEDRRVENNILRMLDFMSNFSLSGENLSDVFRQVANYVEQPLSGALMDFSARVSLHGDTNNELEIMKDKIADIRFKELISNIQVGLKYSANLRNVVMLERRSVLEYLAEKKQRRGQMTEEIVNLLVLAFMSFITLFMVSKLTYLPLREIIAGNIISRVCSLFGMGIILIFFVKILKDG